MASWLLITSLLASVPLATVAEDFSFGFGQAEGILKGTMYESVSATGYGSLKCENALVGLGKVNYIAGCKEAPRTGAAGWMPASGGFCRRCPKQLSSDGEVGRGGQFEVNICVQFGMEYIEGTTIQYSCTFGYTLNATSDMRRCTAAGWEPTNMPICEGNRDPTVVCPSPPTNWSACEASACGEEGYRIRSEGTYAIFPGNDDLIYAQCNIKTSYEDCIKECKPATTAEPTKTTNDVNIEETSSGLEPTTTMESVEQSMTSVEVAEETTMEPTTEEPTTPVETTESTTPVTPEAASTSSTMEAETTEAEITEAVATTVQDPAVEIINRRPIAPGADPNSGSGADSDPAATDGPIMTVNNFSGEDPTEPQMTCLYHGVKYAVGTLLTHTCPDGFRRYDGKGNRSCRVDGTWSGKEPGCIQYTTGRRCPPEHEYWSVCSKECKDIDPDKVGTQNRYMHEFRVYTATPGNVISQCVEHRDTQVCRGEYHCRVPCQPLDIENGRVEVHKHGLPLNPPHGNGTEIEVICDRFYEPSSHPFLKCRHGIWSDILPVCELAPKHSCGPLPDPAFGQCLPFKREYAIGECVTCSCQAGYGNVGSALRYCQEKDEWSGEEALCERGVVRCGSPGQPENGMMHHGHDFGLVGSSVVYQCYHGFTLDGERQLTCQDDGTWDHPRPVCEYNFQHTDDLVQRLHEIPALACQSRTECACMPASHCPQCARRSPYMVNLERSSRAVCCGMCKTCCLDLVFVLDESGSITDKHFAGAVNFTESIVDSYLATHRSNCLRVGAVKFAHKARIIANFTDGSRFLWPESERTPRGGGTGIRCGLSAVNRMMKRARSKCRKIVFVITDGESNFCGDPQRVASKLQCQCSEVYVIGVGSNVRINSLERIASRPTSSHLFLLRGFDDVYKLGAAFRQGIIRF